MVPITADTVRPYYQHKNIYACIIKSVEPSKLHFDPKLLRTAGSAYKDVRKTVASSDFAKTQRINVMSQSTVNTGYREGTTVLHYNPKKTMRQTECTTHPTQIPLASLSATRSQSILQVIWHGTGSFYEYRHHLTGSPNLIPSIHRDRD